MLDGIDRGRGRRVVRAALARADDVWLDPDETRALLEAYGMPLVPSSGRGDPEEAAAAAARSVFPSSSRRPSPGAHKTESGGVALDLRDEDGRPRGGRAHRRRR